MIAVGLSLVVMIASASPTEGTYKITSDKVTVLKELWSLYCDQKAPIQKATPGEALQVTKTKDGGWLARGKNRLFGTGQCEAQNRGLSAIKRAKKSGRIYVKCQSKRVTLGTEQSEQQVWASKDTIWFKTEARRIFRHRGDDCITILQRRTKAVFVPPNVPPEVPSPSSAAKPEVVDDPEPVAEEPAPVDPCEVPGKPAKITLSPKVAVAKVGEKPACYEVTAVDENGCAVSPGKASFALEPKSAGKIDDQGCLTPASLKIEELIGVIATTINKGDDGKNLEAAASARIIPKGEEKSKKSLQALAKTSKSKRVQAVIGEVTRGALVIRPLESDPPELPPLEEPPFPWGAVGGTIGAAFFMTGIGIVFARRRRHDQEVPTELQAAPVVTPKKGGGLVCPKCEFEFAVGEATHCPFDDEVLKELQRDARQTMFVPAAGGMICPVCKTKYPTKARFCGHDRSPLLPDFGQFDLPGDVGANDKS